MATVPRALRRRRRLSTILFGAIVLLAALPMLSRAGDEVFGLGTPIPLPHGGHPTPPPTPTPTPTSGLPCNIHAIPAGAPPDTLVAVAGLCYFIHSGMRGVVYFDDLAVTSGRGDTPGNYSAGFYVPTAAANGVHQLSLRLVSGSIVASVPFTVLPFCRGDCDGNGTVSIEEQRLGVEIALEREAKEACPDLDDDGSVTIDDLVGATDAKRSGCLLPFTPGPTPLMTPTPVGLGGSCHTTDDCQQPDLLCVPPGGFPGCAVCQPEEDECQVDTDCGEAGEGFVCKRVEMLGPECLCTPTRLCVSGCDAPGDCAEGEECTASHCVPIACSSDDDCPRDFDCFFQTAQGACARRPCVAAIDCPDGECVENRCYGARGVCSQRPGL